MKAIPVREAQPRLRELIAEACQGALIVLTDGERQVALEPRLPLDLEQDSPELEAEILEDPGFELGAASLPIVVLDAQAHVAGCTQPRGTWAERAPHVLGVQDVSEVKPAGGRRREAGQHGV